MKLVLMAIAATLAFSLGTSAAYSRGKECPPESIGPYRRRKKSHPEEAFPSKIR